MRRITLHFPLGALVSGLLLSACGGPSAEEQLPVEEEALGTKQSALCYGTTVNSLNVHGVSTYDGVMAGAGDYSVGGGANAVRLEYYADGLLKYSERRTGVSASWNYSYGGFACGTHNFQVKAMPVVITSDGTEATCSSTVVWSAVYNASQPCPTPPSSSLSCSRYSPTTIKCTGTGSGGTGALTPRWQELRDGYGYGWYSGPSTEYFYCATSAACSTNPQPYREAQRTMSKGAPSTQRLPVDGCTLTENLRVQFQVQDANGMASTVNTSLGYTCYVSDYY